MELSDKYIKLLRDIYETLGTNFAHEWKIEVPKDLFCIPHPDDEEKIKSHNEYLSTRFVRLTSIIRRSGGICEKRSLKIWFGPKRKIKSKEKEIIIEFEYASDIVLYIINTINPNNISMKTIDNLFEQENMFSQPYTTFSENYTKNDL